MLDVISVREAKRIIDDNLRGKFDKYEIVHIKDALGRVLFEDVYSPCMLPGFDRSTVDGYAVVASDTYGASESIPTELAVIGEIPMGEAANVEIQSGECVKILTGGMLPKGADCCIMVEYTEETDFGTVLIYKSGAVLSNVTQKDDDVKQGSLVLKRGAKITPSVIGVLAGLGVDSVKVYKKPSVAIISTGNEIISFDDKLTQGKIRDINAPMLCALCEENGCEAHFGGILPDNDKILLEKTKELLNTADIVLISGGSSAGEYDKTVKVLDEIGTVHFHGVAMKPGKPTIFATHGSRAVFGLPGHPGAVRFVFEILVKEAMAALFDIEAEHITTTGIIGANISSNHGREEYLCVKRDGENTYQPLYFKSGVISLFTVADGYIKIDRDCEGLRKSEEISVTLF